MSDRLYKDRPLSEEVSPEQQRQLIRVMEEAAELILAASKILRFGPYNWHPKDPTKETNVAALRRERDDLVEALDDLGEGVKRSRREYCQGHPHQRLCRNGVCHECKPQCDHRRGSGTESHHGDHG